MKTKQFLQLAVLFFIAACGSAKDETTFVNEGEKAPDFTYTTLDGQKMKLSDLEGKVVWLNFFATWCPPCRQELPELEKQVFERLKDNPDFVLLVIGREHSADELRQFKTEQNFTLPFVPDPERKIFAKYASQNIPRNFIVDKNGKIVVASTGFEEEEFAEIINTTNNLLK